MTRQHYIDQRGKIVTTRKDTHRSCKGCCYLPYKYKAKRNIGCWDLVPTEHATDDADLYCIRRLIIYREVS